MYKFDVDWSPSQHLGHDKLTLDNAKLAEAQQRASRAAIFLLTFLRKNIFLKNGDQVLYYTGLPNGELSSNVFQLVIPYPGTTCKYY